MYFTISISLQKGTSESRSKCQKPELLENGFSHKGGESRICKYFSFMSPHSILIITIKESYHFPGGSVQFSCSVILTLCNSMDCSRPSFPVHHQLLELAQTHVHQVSDAIQPSHPVIPFSPPVFSLSQRRGLFK